MIHRAKTFSDLLPSAADQKVGVRISPSAPSWGRRGGWGGGDRVGVRGGGKAGGREGGRGGGGRGGEGWEGREGGGEGEAGGRGMGGRGGGGGGRGAQGGRGSEGRFRMGEGAREKSRGKRDEQRSICDLTAAVTAARLLPEGLSLRAEQRTMQECAEKHHCRWCARLAREPICATA